jgi:branched-chain amino acid transport system substrate-binding protein
VARTRGAVLSIAMLAAVCALSACGSSTTSSSPSTPSGTKVLSSAAHAATGSPIRVAALVNVSGPLPSGEANAAPVMQAWAKAVNSQGGVAGHPVEIVVADTKGDPSTATAQVQKIAGDQSIVAAVMFDAGTEGLVADKITKAKLPVVGGMGYAPNAWGKMPNWLPLTTSIPSIFNMGMVLGKSLGAHRTALTICAEIAGCEAAAPVVENASKKEGMSYVGTYKISSAAPDYTAQCLQILKSKVDYVMLGAAQTTAAMRVAKDCHTQGYSGQWGLFGGVIYPKAMRDQDPGVKLGLVLNSFPWFADAAPVTKYRATMQQEGVPESVYGDLHSTAAYATMELFKKALDADSTLPSKPTRADIVKAYGTVKNETLDGLLPQPVTFHPNKPNALVTCYWFGSYESGKFSDGNLAKPVCDPASLAA